MPSLEQANKSYRERLHKGLFLQLITVYKPRAQNNSWLVAIFHAILYSGHPKFDLILSNCTDGQSKFNFGQPNPKPFF